MRRTIATLGLLVLLTACREVTPAVVGFALGGSLLNAARLAIADETAGAGLPALDTVLMLEPTSAAAPALERARYLAGLKGIVAIVGHSNSAASLAAAPVYGDAHLVQVAPSTTSRYYAQAGPFSFRMVPSDEVQARFLLEILHRDFPNGARVALFYVNDDYGRGLRAGVRPSLDSLPWRVVLDMPHDDVNPRDGVMEQSIAAARVARPDVVLFLGRVRTLNSYLPGLRAELPGRPILSGDAAATHSDIGTADGRWTGVRYVDFVDMDATPALREFGVRYREAFGARASGAEVLTYDAVRLLTAAIRDGARDGESVRRYLHALGRERAPYNGLSGPVAFSESGDIDRALILVTVPSPDAP